MMEIDGLDSAKWQKSRGKDVLRINYIVKLEKDKIMHSIVFFK